MCLERVIENKCDIEGVGYKCVRVTNGQVILNSSYFDIGKWLKATKKQITADDRKKYQTGFHIFLSRKDAETYNSASTWSIVKVSYRKGHTLGNQGGLVVIAQEMKIDEILAEWSNSAHRFVDVK